MAYNAAERKDVRAAEKSSRVFEAARREIIVGLMSTAPGRAWVLELLERCHIFATSFNGEALASAFAEGQRNVGLTLLNDIMASCPNLYVTMMRESNERHQSRASASEHSGSSDAFGGDSADPDAG